MQYICLPSVVSSVVVLVVSVVVNACHCCCSAAPAASKQSVPPRLCQRNKACWGCCRRSCSCQLRPGGSNLLGSARGWCMMHVPTCHAAACTAAESSTAFCPGASSSLVIACAGPCSRRRACRPAACTLPTKFVSTRSVVLLVFGWVCVSECVIRCKGLWQGVWVGLQVVGWSLMPLFEQQCECESVRLCWHRVCCQAAVYIKYPALGASISPATEGLTRPPGGQPTVRRHVRGLSVNSSLEAPSDVTQAV